MLNMTHSVQSSIFLRISMRSMTFFSNLMIKMLRPFTPIFANDVCRLPTAFEVV